MFTAFPHLAHTRGVQLHHGSSHITLDTTITQRVGCPDFNISDIAVSSSSNNDAMTDRYIIPFFAYDKWLAPRILGNYNSFFTPYSGRHHRCLPVFTAPICQVARSLTLLIVSRFDFEAMPSVHSVLVTVP
jgi:hypothetical protein